MTAMETLFNRHFGHPPAYTVRSPGRLELLGNHTDYNHGLVLSVAIDKYIQFSVGHRNDGKIQLVSSVYSDPEIFWLDRMAKNPTAPWANYVKGVLEQLRKRGVHFSGFNAVIHGTIPSGAGMSSSAALEVAAALAVRQLFPFTLTETGLGAPPQRDRRGILPPPTPVERLQFAKICGAAENEYVGVRSGLLDQTSCLFGRAWQVMEIDFQTHAVEFAPMIGEAIIVCDSGVKHSLVDGGYNDLREQCEGAARALGVASLRLVDSRMLAAGRAKLTERQYQCAHHIVSEIQRVMHGIRALRENDHRLFGDYMYQSHKSSRDFFKNSAPELDLLVELARAHPGCLGARLTGGGFGGATINLVAHHQAEDFMTVIARQYRERTGRELKPVICQIVDGAD